MTDRGAINRRLMTWLGIKQTERVYNSRGEFYEREAEGPVLDFFADESASAQLLAALIQRLSGFRIDVIDEATKRIRVSGYTTHARVMAESATVIEAIALAADKLIGGKS